MIRIANLAAMREEQETSLARDRVRRTARVRCRVGAMRPDGGRPALNRVREQREQRDDEGERPVGAVRMR